MGSYVGTTTSYLLETPNVSPAVQKYVSWAKAQEGNPGRTPALDLNFAENKSLVDDVSGSNLVTFTRTSAATYVDSNGVIRSMGLNFSRNSESLNSWPNNGNAISISANSTTAPDGTLTADVLSQTAVTGASRWISSITSTYTAGVTYTLSIWLKKISGTGGQPSINLWVNGGTYQSVGTITTEWVRYSKSFTPVSTISSGTYTGLNVGWNDQGGASDFTFAAWGFQVEVGSSATDYAKTTTTNNSSPRFDHDPDTGESLGLLIEESSTNEWSNSESLVGGTNGYTLPGGLTNPAGGTTAVKIPAGATQTWWNRGTGGFAVTSGDYWTMSWWAYSTNQSVDFGNSDYFNVANTTISQDKTVSAGQWKRCYRTVQFTASGSPQIRLMPYNRTLYTDTNNEVFVWGFQFEKIAFPTSYIPTSGSTVTRSADVASITGTNFSSWYNDTEGTLFIDSAFTDSTNATVPFRFGAYSWAITPGVQQLRQSVTNAGIIGLPSSGSTFKKNAVALKSGDYAVSTDGGTVSTSTNSYSPTNLSNFSINATGNTLNGRLSRLIYWTQRLQNSTLQSLTQ